MIGGLVGLAIVVPAARRRFLIPKRVWDFPPVANWEDRWMGSLTAAIDNGVKSLGLFKAWTPYVLVGLLLMLSRLNFLPFQGLLKALQLNFPAVLGTEIGVNSEPFYLPGTIFILVAILTYFLHSVKTEVMFQATSNAVITLGGTALVLAAAVPMARVFINSGFNESGLASMPVTLADGVANLAAQSWPLFAPIIGAMGSLSLVVPP